MKLFGLALLTVGLVGCAGNRQPVLDQTAPAPHLVLSPPSTAPIPRKVFKGKDWELSVEDDGWRRGSSDATLALLNLSARAVIMLERKTFDGTLDDLALKLQEDFRPDLKYTKTEVVFAGYAGIKYDCETTRSKIWGWAMVANGKSWFLTCGTARSMADENAEMCEDVSKHLVVFKPEEKK